MKRKKIIISAKSFLNTPIYSPGWAYGRSNSLELEAGVLTKDLLAIIHPSDTDPVGLWVVNGRPAPDDARLNDGDEVEIWPLIDGG